MFAAAIRRFRFGKFVDQYLNTGHALIESGFNSLEIEASNSILNIWDKKIGTSKCSCKTSPGEPEILIATSIICSEPNFNQNSDFDKVHITLNHLIKHHTLKTVIGLGINALKDDKVTFTNLPKSQQEFLKYLDLNGVAIGCRGRETFSFLLDLGFKSNNLYLTGCPSLQLINPISVELPQIFSRILVTGALIKRLDLVENMISSDGKFLFIPQTMDSYLVGLAESKKDKRIEIFLPTNLASWLEKLKGWEPQIALGSRLHGGVTAMSLGIPTMIMSGDLRSREVSELGGLKFHDDICEIRVAVSEMSDHDGVYQIGVPERLAQEIYSSIAI